MSASARPRTLLRRKPFDQKSLSRLLIAVLLLAMALIMVSPSSLAEARPLVTTSRASTVALCPSSPMCSRSGAPRAFRGRYCDTMFTKVMSLFSRATGGGGDGAARRYEELPYFSDAALRAHVLREAEQLFAAHLVGQGHVVAPLLEALRKKLQYPSEPLVLHLAGDNGVGKTFTARLLSLALSLRCQPGRDVCDVGDNLLSISGTSFDGLSVSDARRVIVGRIMQHMTRHPHGIVLIDDFTAMDPALVPVLAPLFGRAAHYPEQFVDDLNAPPPSDALDGDVHSKQRQQRRPQEKRGAHKQPAATAAVPSLGQLLVIITTDLGQQGRTMGKSSAQIEQLVRDNFAELYGSLLPSYTRTYAYLPFTTHVAAAVVRAAVANLPCTVGAQAAIPEPAPPAASSSRSLLGALLSRPHDALRTVSVIAGSIEEVAVQFLVEKHRDAWEGKENGHALRRVVEDELVAQVLAYQQDKGLDNRLVARFVLDEEKMAVVLDSTMGNGKFMDQEEEGEEGEAGQRLSHDL